MIFKVDCLDNTSDLKYLASSGFSYAKRERNCSQGILQDTCEMLFDFAVRSPGDLLEQRQQIKACKRGISS